MTVNGIYELTNALVGLLRLSEDLDLVGAGVAVDGRMSVSAALPAGRLPKVAGVSASAVSGE
jgi:hypothetical protein